MFCLDTDVLSTALRPRPSLPLIRRLAVIPPDEQCTTAINVGELLYGAHRSGRSDLRALIEEHVVDAIAVLPFDAAAADTYARIRVELERAGTHLDEPDLRIAAIAISRELTLVSGNVRHFARVPGLALQDWLGTSDDG